MEPRVTVDELNAFLAREYPELNGPPVPGRPPVYAVHEVGPDFATVRLEAGPAHIRPGGTVSGPTLMTVVDIACWLAILAQIGTVALTVTTHLSIDFVRKPAPGPLHARAKVIKLGSRLAVTTCEITAPEGGPVFAHASATYSIPPASQRG